MREVPRERYRSKFIDVLRYYQSLKQDHVSYGVMKSSKAGDFIKKMMNPDTKRRKYTIPPKFYKKDYKKSNMEIEEE